MFGFMTNTISLYGSYDLAMAHSTYTLHTFEQMMAKSSNTSAASAIALAEILFSFIFSLAIAVIQVKLLKGKQLKETSRYDVKWNGSIT